MKQNNNIDKKIKTGKLTKNYQTLAEKPKLFTINKDS